MRILLCTLIVFFLNVGHAFAHQPYVIKEGMIKAPSGETLILETLNGDGIFTADPEVFQIRNQQGSVIAHTEVATHVSYYCPSVEFCWAFPYGQLNLFARGWKLDTSTIKWSSVNDVPDFKGGDDIKLEQEFSDYLLDDKVARFNSWALGDPIGIEGSSGFVSSTVSYLVSPAMIIADQWGFILSASVLFFTFICSYKLLVRVIKDGSMPARILKGLAGFIIFATSGLTFIIGLFVMGFTLSANIPFLWVGVFIGGILQLKISRFLKRKTPSGNGVSV